MSKSANYAEPIELDDEFIYISDQGCERVEPKIDYDLNYLPVKPLKTGKKVKSKIEAICPTLDVEYLFRSRYKQLKGFIRRRVHNDQDAEDIAQNTYLEALKKAESYQGLSRPDVWLFGIALNLVRNHRKKESNRARMWEENYGHDQSDYIEVESSPCNHLGNNQVLGKVSKAIEKLPNEMSQVLKAVAIESKSYQEVAKSLGLPTGTVRSRLSRARDKIKNLSEL